MQEADNLNSLLTAEGLKQLKMMCFRNLDVKAKDIDEMELISRFMERAKQVVIECTKLRCIKNIVFTGNLCICFSIFNFILT